MNRAALIWRVASFAVAAGFIALWQLIANLKLVSPVFLPGPDRAWAALVRGFSTGDLWSKLAGTLEHMAYGWLAASIAGIAIGAIIGSSRTMRTYVAPSLEFLRPLPVSAIIPVAIAMLGLTQAMALFVIAFGAIWPIMLATIHGFAAVEPRLYEVARSLQMSRLAVIFKIALPSASPDILAGMRLSLTVALILSVVCEILAGLDGLGHWVLLSARAFRSADLFAGVILLGVTGYVTSVAMSMAETSAIGVAGGAALVGSFGRRSILRHTLRHRFKPDSLLFCPDHVSANVPQPPPGGFDTEGDEHLMVPHPLAALDQAEITDDAIRPAAHAGELRTLKMIAHTRQHARSMHRTSIPSILTAAELTPPTCEAVKALRCCRARRCDVFARSEPARDPALHAARSFARSANPAAQSIPVSGYGFPPRPDPRPGACDSRAGLFPVASRRPLVTSEE